MHYNDLPNHHAILIVHKDRLSLSNQLFSELQKLSPLHRIFSHTVLDTDTAKDIISFANTSSNNQEKVILLCFHTIGLEAQNRLLKILEEPRTGVRFILITSSVAKVIPTVLSRTLVLNVDEESTVTATTDFDYIARLFLKTHFSERSKLPEILQLLSRVDEEERKDREAVSNFISALLSVITKNKVDSRYIKETLQMLSFSSDPSASGKAIIEYLALLLPQTEV